MPVKRITDSRGVEHVSAQGGGPFIKDPRNLVRDAEALRMRAEEGLTYPEIAERIGLKSPHGAQAAVKRAIDVKWPRSQEHADALRAEENRKLDEAERVVWGVLADLPLDKGSSGRVVIDPRTGEPQRDKRAALTAVGQLVAISRRRARMNGLDVAVESRASLRITTDIDREIGAYLGTLSAAGQNDTIVAALLETFAETAPLQLAPPRREWNPDTERDRDSDSGG